MRFKVLVVWCVFWAVLWAIFAVDALTGGYPPNGPWGMGILMYVLSLPLSATYSFFFVGPDIHPVVFLLYCTVSSFIFWFVLVQLTFLLIRRLQQIKHRSKA